MIISRVRRFYWKHVRGYRYEVCGSVPRSSPAYPVISRGGCGRPVGLVWHATTATWDAVVAPGAPSTTEGAGGILCIHCFDRLAYASGKSLLWRPGPL